MPHTHAVFFARERINVLKNHKIYSSRPSAINRNRTHRTVEKKLTAVHYILVIYYRFLAVTASADRDDEPWQAQGERDARHDAAAPRRAAETRGEGHAESLAHRSLLHNLLVPVVHHQLRHGLLSALRGQRVPA